jgi:hypothetical protein
LLYYAVQSNGRVTPDLGCWEEKKAMVLGRKIGSEAFSFCIHYDIIVAINGEKRKLP